MQGLWVKFLDFCLKQLSEPPVRWHLDMGKQSRQEEPHTSCTQPHTRGTENREPWSSPDTARRSLSVHTARESCRAGRENRGRGARRHLLGTHFGIWEMSWGQQRILRKNRKEVRLQPGERGSWTPRQEHVVRKSGWLSVQKTDANSAEASTGPSNKEETGNLDPGRLGQGRGADGSVSRVQWGGGNSTEKLVKGSDEPVKKVAAGGDHSWR